MKSIGYRTCLNYFICRFGPELAEETLNFFNFCAIYHTQTTLTLFAIVSDSNFDPIFSLLIQIR
ncbi:hypothetical protein XIS1_510014 [Xenorhabdus innexi]|uniref:Uncharacterized protein n=1 Tax=Xenorhabdus innexi TaxID=290109 RepID=A0A1N6MZ32_9GAMM|nr:hypothetical protein XIS1_510014 [Xenorhabdus innexi]